MYICGTKTIIQRRDLKLNGARENPETGRRTYTKINGAFLRRRNIERKTDCGENQ